MLVLVLTAASGSGGADAFLVATVLVVVGGSGDVGHL